MVYKSFIKAKDRGEKQFAILVDPDKIQNKTLFKLIAQAQLTGVDYFFVGSSLLLKNNLDNCLEIIKSECDIPCVIFPGNTHQLSRKADAVLFLSLISGRNAEFLIGQQVISAPYLKNSGLEIISTGYMLIDGGVPTSVSYMSNTTPIPANKADIAVSTAMAGEMLGLKLIYLEAGSGTRHPVKDAMINAVSKTIDVPLIVGGGIRTAESARSKLDAGADIIVIGNGIEKNPRLIPEVAEVAHSFQKSKSGLD